MTRMMSGARPRLEDCRNTTNIAFPASGLARLESERAGPRVVSRPRNRKPENSRSRRCPRFATDARLRLGQGTPIGSGAWHAGSALIDHGRHHWMGDVPAIK